MISVSDYQNQRQNLAGDRGDPIEKKGRIELLGSNLDRLRKGGRGGSRHRFVITVPEIFHVAYCRTDPTVTLFSVAYGPKKPIISIL